MLPGLIIPEFPWRRLEGAKYQTPYSRGMHFTLKRLRYDNERGMPAACKTRGQVISPIIARHASLAEPIECSIGLPLLACAIIRCRVERFPGAALLRDSDTAHSSLDVSFSGRRRERAALSAMIHRSVTCHQLRLLFITRWRTHW